MFHTVCKLSELQPNVPSTFEVDDRFVLLTLIDGNVYCIDDICTHDGATLGGGEIIGGNCIECPRHGARFDLRTGDVLAMPATEPTCAHEVKIDGDSVLVRIND